MLPGTLPVPRSCSAKGGVIRRTPHYFSVSDAQSSPAFTYHPWGLAQRAALVTTENASHCGMQADTRQREYSLSQCQRALGGTGGKWSMGLTGAWAAIGVHPSHTTTPALDAVYIIRDVYPHPSPWTLPARARRKFQTFSHPLVHG